MNMGGRTMILSNSSKPMPIMRAVFYQLISDFPAYKGRGNGIRYLPANPSQLSDEDVLRC